VNTVIDPSVLFISESDWKDSQKQDAFLNHLFNNLDTINMYSLTKIYWTDEFESNLWECQQPPWIYERDWRNLTIPVFNKKIKDLKLIIKETEEAEFCTVSPSLNQSYNLESVCDCFLKIIHTILSRNENVFFCVGLENKLKDNERFSFQCNCHPFHIEPESIFQHNDWLKFIDLENDYWPSTVCDEDFCRFDEALRLMADREFSSLNNTGFIYDYEFENKFIEDVIKERNFRRELLYSLTNRLFLNQKEASNNSGLRDEPVIGHKGIRRFRVTGENRIHYSYPGRGKILFLRYYGEGQHDRGLNR